MMDFLNFHLECDMIFVRKGRWEYDNDAITEVTSLFLAIIFTCYFDGRGFQAIEYMKESGVPRLQTYENRQLNYKLSVPICWELGSIASDGTAGLFCRNVNEDDDKIALYIGLIKNDKIPEYIAPKNGDLLINENIDIIFSILNSWIVL